MDNKQLQSQMEFEYEINSEGVKGKGQKSKENDSDVMETSRSLEGTQISHLSIPEEQVVCEGRSEFFEKRPLSLEFSDANWEHSNPEHSRFLFSPGAETVEQTKHKLKNKSQKYISPTDSFISNYQEFVRAIGCCRITETFREFSLRRNIRDQKNSNSKLDLGTCSLLEVVALARQKGLVSRNLFNEFQLQSPGFFEEMFVDTLTDKKLSSFDYFRQSFTPMDHRMLSTAIKIQFPRQFEYPTRLSSYSQKLTIFYSYLYSIPDEQYWEAYQAFNTKNCRTWMPLKPDIISKLPNSSSSDKFEIMAEDDCLINRSGRKLRKRS